ncbi:MAG TPA: farnesyl diphosphate synthase [Pseudomonadales bacterium]
MASDLQPLLRARQARIERELQRALRCAAAPASLVQAMEYAVLGGGKRLRPQLAYAAAEAVGGDSSAADIAACAVEMIHAYSLIHDDLPAMDDDVLRRGRPTCHVVFGEALAILAGDALQALAFDLLASSPRLATGHATRLRMLTELARASGAPGMVGGQALDIAATGTLLDETQLSRMHGMKTGALIIASVVLGALSTNCATEMQLRHLREFARLTGLAFQIRDDILDVEADSATSGKQQGKDAQRNKPTYTSVLGLDGARVRLQQAAEAADRQLQGFGPEAGNLRALARMMLQRKS